MNGHTAAGPAGGDADGWHGAVRPSGTGLVGQALDAASRLYAAPTSTADALLVTGAILGALGDALLRAAGPPGLNLSLWVAAVAAAALVLQRRAALAASHERAAWLAIGVVFAAGFAWRDAPELKLMALGAATLAFALAAHRRDASWVRRAGVTRYAGALALGALHAWTAPPLAMADAARSRPGCRAGRRGGAWRRAGAVARGLALAAPLVVLFGALFTSADAVFARLVADLVQFDVEWAASHVVVFAILGWIAAGYLRGFLTGTAPPSLRGVSEPDAVRAPLVAPVTLGFTEVVTVLAVLDLLFLAFVVVQFRYLFGGDALVQVTPDLTYADYARRGFFELVMATALVVPLLLAADWMLDRSRPRHAFVFAVLAGVQIALMLAIAVSALQRLRLYVDSYGLTEPRFYAAVLLVWLCAVLGWLGTTVLRGRRHAFAFGALSTGFAVLALLFVLAPDALIVRTNVARSAAGAAPFDAVHATSLSADGLPVLIEALPSLALPADARCRLARQMLRRWGPDRDPSWRSWNWSAARARDAVRQHEARLREMVGPDARCAAPASPQTSAKGGTRP